MTATAVAAIPHAVVELVPLTRIIESASNPRRTFTEIEDLAEDIKRRGVLQPILVRPSSQDGLASNMLELVFGARRYRAAKLAGLEAIPAMVRDLSALEALEIQVVENSARQDVHPMEEAEGLERLRELSPGGELSAEEIASKIGKSPSYVRGRIKLLDLCKEAREAFYAGSFTATTALLVARIPDQGVQRAVLQELKRFGDDDEAWPVLQVSHTVRRHLLRLADAPFPKDDPELAPGAGPCSTCAKRSGAQPALFSDVDKHDGDLCTDPACYRKKMDAGWARQRAAAESRGLKVLEGKAATKALEYGGEYVNLDSTCQRDPKYRTWKQLVGKISKDQVVLARTDDGRVEEVLPKTSTSRLLKAAGHDFKKSREESSSGGDRAEREKAKRAREVDEAVDRRVVELVVARMEQEDVSKLWGAAARSVALIGDMSLERRWPSGHGAASPQKDVDKAIEAFTPEQARAFVLEVAFERCLYDSGFMSADDTDLRAQILAWAKIDTKALRAQVRAELEAGPGPAQLLEWVETKKGWKGRREGRTYLVQKGARGWGMERPGTSVGCGGAGPFKTVEEAKAAAEERERDHFGPKQGEGLVTSKVDAAVAHLGIKSDIPELEWKPGRGNGTQVAAVKLGRYELASKSGAWTARWLPSKGRDSWVVSGTGRPDKETKEACWRHHLDLLATEATGIKEGGEAITRKKGGRR